jgi:hypothetical protein
VKIGIVAAILDGGAGVSSEVFLYVCRQKDYINSNAMRKGATPPAREEKLERKKEGKRETKKGSKMYASANSKAAAGATPAAPAAAPGGLHFTSLTWKKTS